MRREVFERYGEKKLYEGGLSVRTTLDPKLQVVARKTLSDGLVNFDEAQGYRGAIQKLDLTGDWGVKLADVKSLSDIGWKMAVVLESNDQSARIGFQPPRELGGAVSQGTARPATSRSTACAGRRPRRDRRGAGRRPRSTRCWSRATSSMSEPLTKDGNKVEGQFRLRQVPEVSGGMVVMDPWTGRVLAMSGGFSFDQSQFNRATQAWRQPGSSFKPLVYSAALDNGYTPSTVVIDAPIEVEQGNGQVWRPENYSTGKYYGPSTLRIGIEQSRNTMTVRLAAGHRHAADRRIRQALRRL